MTHREFDASTKGLYAGCSPGWYRREIRRHVPSWVRDPLASRCAGAFEGAALLRAYPKNDRIRARIRELERAGVLA